MTLSPNLSSAISLNSLTFVCYLTSQLQSKGQILTFIHIWIYLPISRINPTTDQTASTTQATKVIKVINQDKISILMNACEKSVSTTVAILANHPDIKLHTMDPNGMNAVYYAIKNPDEN